MTSYRTRDCSPNGNRNSTGLECIRSPIFFRFPSPSSAWSTCGRFPARPATAGYGMQKIIDHALRDAEALMQGGVDGLAVENMWDFPYYVGNDVKPEAMTAHAVAAAEVVKNFPVPVGINVIHNGGVVCLSIARRRRRSLDSRLHSHRRAACGTRANSITAARRS